MARPPADIEDFLKEKARTDPGYAIAYAIMRLAAAQEVLAHRVDALGFNVGQRDAPGTTEKIAMELQTLVGSARDLVDVIGSK